MAAWPHAENIQSAISRVDPISAAIIRAADPISFPAMGRRSRTDDGLQRRYAGVAEDRQGVTNFALPVKRT